MLLVLIGLDKNMLSISGKNPPTLFLVRFFLVAHVQRIRILPPGGENMFIHCASSTLFQFSLSYLFWEVT